IWQTIRATVRCGTANRPSRRSSLFRRLILVACAEGGFRGGLLMLQAVSCNLLARRSSSFGDGDRAPTQRQARQSPSAGTIPSLQEGRWRGPPDTRELTFWAKSSIVSTEGTEVLSMPDFAGALGASKQASTLLVLFIPSKDRTDQAIDQEYWVGEALGV